MNMIFRWCDFELEATAKLSESNRQLACDEQVFDLWSPQTGIGSSDSELLGTSGKTANRPLDFRNADLPPGVYRPSFEPTNNLSSSL